MTIRTLLDTAIAVWGKHPAMRFHHNGAWNVRTFREFGIRVHQLAEVLGSLNLQPQHDHIAIWMENRPEWLEIYSAIAGSGLIAVPVDPKLRPQEAAYIFDDAKVTTIFAGKQHRSLLEAILPQLPALQNVIILDDAENRGKGCANRQVLDYEERLAQADCNGAWFERHRPLAQHVASVLYTSGTTGKPKGAMLTHLNFCSNAAGALDIISDVSVSDTFLVVLPLFHAFSFTANFIVPLNRGCALGFVRSLRTFAEDMTIIKPSIIMGVPLLLEKIYARIDERLRSNRAARILLAMGLGRLIGYKVKQSMGGRLRMLVSGGAPCPSELLRKFRRLGIGTIEGYGLTEASPIVTLSRVKDARPGSIGYKLPNIVLRVANSDANGIGELQIRGPIVMKGYLNNESATREAFDGPWLRTGDLATVDRHGYYRIKGRQKALIVNREGKNIYPEEVELCIAQHPYIQDILVLGYQENDDAGEKVGAIVTANLDAMPNSDGKPLTPAEIEKELRQAIATQCQALADYKHPRKIVVYHEPLDRTPTQKIQRHRYQGLLNT